MSSMPISNSVGIAIAGQNTSNDIKAVQAALNKMLGEIPPTKKCISSD